MAGEKMVVDFECFKGDEEAYKSLKEATQKLTNATEAQFEEIKREKWYNRVFDMVTYSKKNEKRIAEQISSLAEAQQILIEILLRLSEEDTKVARMVSECMNDIKKLSEQDVFLLKKIRNLENIMLGIKVASDIADLASTNKITLSGCLYYLAEYYDNSSEEQKRYANIVLEYIGTDATVENLSYAIEKMESEDRKKVLTCCIEYMFLANSKMEIPDTLQDFIDEFDFGNKTISEIKEQTIAMYNLRGIDGFYGKYDSASYCAIENEFEFEFDADKIDDEIVELDITGLQHIQKGEEKEFRNNKIHLKTNIICEGILKFKHCILYYNETNDGNKIVLDDKGSLIMEDSVIFCKGYNESAFITGEYDDYVTVKFTYCNFIDCSNFLKIDDARGLLMENCKIYNCFSNFVKCDLSITCEQVYCNIANNKIIVNANIQQFNLEKGGYNDSMFTITGTDHVNISNNIIEETEKFRKKDKDSAYACYGIVYFTISKSGKINNCTFVGAENCIHGGGRYSSETFIIDNCRFLECREVIQYYNGIISDCVFKSCTEIVMYRGPIVRSCCFIDCYNTLFYTGFYTGECKIEYCEFSNIMSTDKKEFDENACIVFSGKRNYIKDCFFDGTDLKDMYLIAAKDGARANDIDVSVERCIFENCFVKGKNLIQEYIQCNSLFKKNQRVRAIRISECRGLDKINQGSEKKDNDEDKESTLQKVVGANELGTYGARWKWKECCANKESGDTTRESSAEKESGDVARECGGLMKATLATWITSGNEKKTF